MPRFGLTFAAVKAKAKKTVDGQYWSRLPGILQGDAERGWQNYARAAEMAGARIPVDAGFRACACRVFAISEFVAGLCQRVPGVLTDLLDSGDLLADSWPGVISRRVGRQLADCRNEGALHQTLRSLRQREMLRIAWRDLAGWATLDETLSDLSDLADACIQGALNHLSQWLAEEAGAPLDSNRSPSPLIVIAMGKLGAHELNFSSDIDLIFAYPDADIAAQPRNLSVEQYFNRLGQSLIRALSDVDQDGFVFRVDMRLRPYGDSGALVCGFEAMEEYYQSQGREWERYAMIKARAVTGDAASKSELRALLRPFVYRRYLDFHTFDALRDLKRQIQLEVKRKGKKENLKLGPGGIRELEFIAQVFQLVRGGREPRLRQRGVLVVLPALAELNLLPSRAVAELIDAYRFLRRAENRLQAMRDQQTHTLPEGESDRARLALAMNMPDWGAFYQLLNQHRRCVETHFQAVFALTPAENEAASDPLKELWQANLEGDEARRVLEAAGFDDAEEALRWVQQLRHGTAPRHLGQQGRLRFDALVPMLLAAAGREQRAAEVLARLVSVLEHIAGRTTYLALLQENPPVMTQLVKLCAASPWIAQQIARFPILLDQLLDPRTLYAPLARAELETELERYLTDVDEADLERQMDLLRQFRHAMVLRVAATDIAGVNPVTRVSDELTAIAEVVVGKVLSIAWTDMVNRYGEPRCKIDGRRRPVAFTVIGYGKLGGMELGYGSDLDLVFLHDSGGRAQKTAGPKTVDNSVFFTRLGQRIIHMLETFTAAGTLYEVDMRLRPSGHSGMLVSSLEAFADYQREEAWIWEHQALVRARPVAGDPGLGKAFQQVRAQVLAADSAVQDLRSEVRQMRERMRAELGSSQAKGFHLKQDRGGIVDIEFMVQYLVLRWCKEHAELLRHTDTIHLLEALATAGLLKSVYAQTLIEAYRQYRAVSHRLTLAEASSVVDDDQLQLQLQRQRVAKIWKQLMES